MCHKTNILLFYFVPSFFFTLVRNECFLQQKKRSVTSKKYFAFELRNVGFAEVATARDSQCFDIIFTSLIATFFERIQLKNSKHAKSLKI